MLSDWDRMTEILQLRLAREALARASEMMAGQAESLAAEMEYGRLEDRGGADALRLFAAVMRVNSEAPCPEEEEEEDEKELMQN